ncbi:hypothetical protein [Allobaculum sp. Allo2]|uniref:hypothetical protein n=1 Tax=Allobaculum sp. Allo2 TaxID=2853432 RepID=UPI001F6008F4|nr:hypothetical protein [Allobaculum sp. Allo2]UNT92570.1 hypothetical protein KWG61_10525 [Allobaculum sp. Allo2]
MHWGVSLSETRAILARNYSLEDLQKSCFAPFYGGMGVTYGACTRIANGLKLSATDHQRAEARIYYELKNACFQSGSTFIVRPFLYELCERMDHFEESLITLSNCEMIKLEKTAYFRGFSGKRKIRSAIFWLNGCFRCRNIRVHPILDMTGSL